MTILLSAILIIGLVILIHELGHFVAAKLCGIHVITFNIGLGPRLFKIRLGNTYYCLSILPIGGYVRLLHHTENEVSKDAPKFIGALVSGSKEEDELRSDLIKTGNGNYLKVSQLAKLFFLSNGLIFNIIFALCILTYKFELITRVSPTLVVTNILSNTESSTIGLENRDIITAVNEVKILNWADLYKEIKKQHQDEVVAITLQRYLSQDVKISTAAKNLIMQYDGERYYFPLGFEPETVGKNWSILQSLILSIKTTFSTSVEFIFPSFSTTNETKSKRPVFYDRVETKYDRDGSFGLLQSMYSLGRSGSKSFHQLLIMIYSFSLIAALLNALPIPGFDGGQILIVLLESISKRKTSFAFKEQLAYFGLLVTLILLLLSLFADMIWIKGIFLK